MHCVKCSGCGAEVEFNGEDSIRCPRCGSIVADTSSRFGKGDAERLAMAEGFRRVGRFDDSQQELEMLLQRHEGSGKELFEAEFGCILNYYEVTEYSFDGDDRVKTCKCYSTDRRPVDKNKDWQDLKQKCNGAQKKQWVALCETIELMRLRNVHINDSIPRYRAIILYDYSNEEDAKAAHGLYEILAKKTDVFFPPVSLKDVPFADREAYLTQIITDPDLARLMFVVFSDAYNLRKKSANYYTNIARQCEDFAKVHTKDEMISVTCDFSPPAMIKRLSIKTIWCEDFDEESYENIAEVMLDKIVDTYDDGEYDDFNSGIAVALNEDGLSPLIKPID